MINQKKCYKWLVKILFKKISIKIYFKLEVNSEDINETQTGYALIKNDQFYYKLKKEMFYVDGKTVWTLFQMTMNAI